MDKATKLLIYAAAAHMLLSMMAIVIESRKRKRGGNRVSITYRPMEERDRIRFDYLNTKIWRSDTTCINMLSLAEKGSFIFAKCLEIVVCLKTLDICVLRSRWLCF